MWHVNGTANRVQPQLIVGRGGNKASRKYLRGKGVLSDRDGPKGKQHRRLAMASIQELIRQGEYSVRYNTMTGNRMSRNQPASAVAWGVQI